VNGINFLWSLLAFTGAIVIMVVFHEWGHYQVARWCGVRVLRFSVGFGRVLWKWQKSPQHTEWAISAIPLGGYVKMLDQREGPVQEKDLPYAFDQQTLLRRTLIVLAGPLANFLLAVLLYWLLLMAGMPGLKAFVDEPVTGSPAAVAGIHAGDEVLLFNGQAVEDWSDFNVRILQAALSHEVVELSLRTADGRMLNRSLDLTRFEAGGDDPDLARRVGLIPWKIPLEPVVGQVIAGTAAEAAGLRPGDRILSIQGKPVVSWQELVKIIHANPEVALELELRRNGQWMKLQATPARRQDSAGHAVGILGVTPRLDEASKNRMTTIVRQPPLAALGGAFGKTLEMTRLTLQSLKGMLTGELSARNVGGAIQIADYAGQAARVGWAAYFSFIAFISIGLGVINLFPIPVLDGGHLMYHVAEWVRGRPLSEQTMMLSQKVGFAILMMLMGFALYNDIQRLITN
jgi:regulator of sigma E protease